MTNRKREEEEWQKLFERVANESDPQRLSELIDQLIKKLDARREQAFAAVTRDPKSERKSTW